MLVGRFVLVLDDRQIGTSLVDRSGAA